jgi:hypothetical protein
LASAVATPFTFATTLLGVAQAATATTIGGEITRSFISPGLPALDCCPQLTVHIPAFAVASTQPAGPLSQGHKRTTGLVWIATYVITAVRCVPMPDEKGNPPSIELMEAAAEQVDQDVWAILNAVYQADRGGLVFAGLCSEVIIDGASPLDPSGGCVGWTIRYRASIPGIRG